MMCPFCNADPYHYVDNGVGMERVAIICCGLGLACFGEGEDDRMIEVSVGELRKIGNDISAMQAMLAAYFEKYGEIWSEVPANAVS